MPEDYVSQGLDGGVVPQSASGKAAWLRRGFELILKLGSIVLVIVTFLPLLHPLWPLSSVAEHFALQVLMAATLLGLLAILLKRWRWLGIIGGIAFIQAWTIHPYWPSVAAATPEAAEVSVKVVSLNVWYRNHDYAAVASYLRGSGADIIGLVEVQPKMKAALAGLSDLYPYRIDCVGAEPNCEEMLLSKRPFLRQGAGRVDGRLPVVAWGEVALDDSGHKAVFAVSHVAWPLLAHKDPGAGKTLPKGLPRLVQTEHVLALAGALNRLGPDLVLLGDYNAAPWSRTQEYLRARTGLSSSGSAALSWPSWGPALIRLPIDQIMIRGDLRRQNFVPGPDVGSDHLPVEATIALGGT